jgi:hypothetical protein
VYICHLTKALETVVLVTACINTIIKRINFVSVMCICFRHINLFMYLIYFTLLRYITL